MGRCLALSQWVGSSEARSNIRDGDLIHLTQICKTAKRQMER